MKLYDKGIIYVEKHPGEYLKEAKVFDERLTIRQLLWHTSGVPDFDQDTDINSRKNGFKSKEIKKALKNLAEYPMHFEPGKGHIYANINYIILL